MTQTTPIVKAEPALPSVRLTRRQFLQSGTRLAIGLGLGLPSLQWLAGCAPTPKPIWDELAAGLQGTLLRPGAPNFAQRASPWALQYASTLPQGIAQCANAQDVQTCLQWAQSNKIPLVARSGGHSYAGYSTTTGLMIDVSSMNTVTIDASTGIANVGGGARNSNIYTACRPFSRAVTHGRCKGVGVAGLVLGGGIGFNMRAHGLTCDQLQETQLVLADGRILTCNEKENADLFWACRGAGGGNFGIHTAFTFQTFPVDKLTVFDISWTDRIPETFAAINAMTQSAPNALGMKTSLTAKKEVRSTELTLSVLGQLAGSPADLNALLAPIFAVQQPSTQDIRELPYWDGQEFVSDAGLPEYSHERSRFVSGAISSDAIQTILSNLNAWPGTGVAATWKYFLLGGQIDAKRPTDTAFVHRNHSMISSVELEWLPTDSTDVVAQNEKWLASFHDQMEQYTSPYCYQNFIDASQSGYLQAYYGDNLPQLQTIKRKYDPSNVFHYPQSIPL